jgi:hypothetical protein
MTEKDARKIRAQAYKDYRLGTISRQEMQRILAATRREQ